MTSAATLDDSLQLQADQNVLVAPVQPSSPSTPVPTPDTNATLSIALANQTTSSTVYAYITGLASANNDAVFLLESDGQTPYYPANVTSVGTALGVNCAIPLGSPGSSTTCTIPYIDGGRIWFSQDATLTFLLNPGTTGPALVEPSVTNPADPNIDTTWDFCEFSFNTSQLYANISYVDFVCMPIALTLLDTAGNTQHVAGMAAGGLDTVCSGLTAQTATDGWPWSSLIVQNNGANLRALSPNNGIIMNSSLFSGYFGNYIDDVWTQYSTENLTVDTQDTWGVVTAEVSDGVLSFSGVGSFAKPVAADIFSCSTGPFAAASTNTAEMGDLTARLAAAFNRSTLLIDTDQPDNENPSNYYQNSITNHYARVVHSANLDGRGYAFPYDDVGPSSGADQSGFLSSGIPSLWTVTVGGANASARPRKRTNGRRTTKKIAQRQPNAKRSLNLNGAKVSFPMLHQKRGIPQFFGSNGFPDEKASLRVYDIEEEERGQTKEQHLLTWNEESTKPKFNLPPVVQSMLDSKFLAKMRSLAEDPRIRPFIAMINTIIASVLSITMRAFLSRVFVVFFVVLVYVLVELRGEGAQDSQPFQKLLAINGTTPAI